MGVIERQGIKNSILNYTGAAIGILSTLLIYPLDRSIYGYAQFLYNTSFFLVPFASIGINALIIKFFPKFQDEQNKNHGFLGLSLLIALCSFTIFCLLLIIFKGHFIHFIDLLKMDSQRLTAHFKYILPLTFLFVFIGLFSSHIFNLRQIVFPNFVQNFLFKIVLPSLVFLHFIDLITKREFSLLYLGFFGFVLLSLIGYLIYRKSFFIRPDFSFITEPLRKEMSSFLRYSSLNSIGSLMVYRIDIIMVAMLLGFTDTGSYGIFLMLTSLLEIPRKSINQIASPVISEAWSVNDVPKIGRIFTKSSNVLLLIGLFLFLAAWLSIDEIVALSTNTEALAKVKYIFFYLGLAKLVELSTSVNTQIIVYSAYYRYNLVFILIMGICTVVTNYFLINAHGVVGAAIATSITILIYNILKMLFIYYKFRLQPFTMSNLLMLVLALIAYFAVSALPVIDMPLISLFVKSAIFTGIFLIPAFFLKLSPEINSFVIQTINRYLK